MMMVLVPMVETFSLGIGVAVVQPKFPITTFETSNTKGLIGKREWAPTMTTTTMSWSSSSRRRRRTDVSVNYSNNPTPPPSPLVRSTTQDVDPVSSSSLTTTVTATVLSNAQPKKNNKNKNNIQTTLPSKNRIPRNNQFNTQTQRQQHHRSRSTRESTLKRPKQQQQQQTQSKAAITTTSTTQKTNQKKKKERPRFFSETDVQWIRDSVDLVSVVESYELEQFRKNIGGSGGATALCPFHDDHHPSFSIDASRGMFQCFACKQAGDVFQFVRLMHNLVLKKDNDEMEMSYWDAIRYVQTTFMDHNDDDDGSGGRAGGKKLQFRSSPSFLRRHSLTKRAPTGVSSPSNHNNNYMTLQDEQRKTLYKANAAAATFYVDQLLQLSSGGARYYLTTVRG